MKARMVVAIALALLITVGFAGKSFSQEKLTDNIVKRVITAAYKDIAPEDIKIKMKKKLTSRYKVNLEIEGRNAIVYLKFTRYRNGARWWFERDPESSLVYLSSSYKSARKKASSFQQKSAEKKAKPTQSRTETITVQEEVKKDTAAKPKARQEVKPARGEPEKKAEAVKVEVKKEEAARPEPVVEKKVVAKEVVEVSEAEPATPEKKKETKAVKEVKQEAKPAAKVQPKVEAAPVVVKEKALPREAPEAEPKAVEIKPEASETPKAEKKPEPKPVKEVKKAKADPRPEPVREQAKETKPVPEPEEAEVGPAPEAKNEVEVGPSPKEKEEEVEIGPAPKNETKAEVGPQPEPAREEIEKESNEPVPVALATGPEGTSKEFIVTLVSHLIDGNEAGYPSFLLRQEEMAMEVDKRDFDRGVELWTDQLRKIHKSLAAAKNVTVRQIILQRARTNEIERATIASLRKRISNVNKVFTYVKVNLLLDNEPAYISIGGLMQTDGGWRIGGRISFTQQLSLK